MKNSCGKRLIGWLVCLVMVLAVVPAACSAGGAEAPVFRQAGSIVTLGRYEQDHNAGNGPEPIEWIILDMQEGRALLLSRYALDTMPYNTESADVTWETCSLRAWLNDEFLNNTFTDEERAAILLSDLDNSSAAGFPGYAWPSCAPPLPTP